jgi:hypothetical protein
MKKLMILALATTVALGSPLFADDDKKDQPKKKRSNILAELGLSKQERKKVIEATKPIQAKRAALRKNKDLPRKEKAAKSRELAKEYNEALKKVLTEEQMKKYTEIQAKRRAANKKKDPKKK